MNVKNHIVQFGIDLSRLCASPSKRKWHELLSVSCRRARYIERVGSQYFATYERQRMFYNLSAPDCVAINVLNPKLTIFFFAFLPQFVSGSTAPVLRMLMLSAVFMLATFVVFALYGWAAAAMRRHVLERPRVVQWLRRAFAGTYVALAGRLAVEGR